MRKQLNKLFMLMALLVGAFSLSGCYFNEEVSNNEVGIKLNENRIVQVVGPGVYSDFGFTSFWADFQRINLQTITMSVEDPEVFTKDNQPVGVKITISAQRKSDAASVTNMLTNWANLVNDDNMIATISSNAREGMKVGVKEFSLDDLLNDRNNLANSITTAIQEDADKYSVSIVKVTVENISPSAAYTEVLEKKALLTAELDMAKKQQEIIKQDAANQQLTSQMETRTLEEKLKQAEAQTAIDLEIARREGEKIKAANAIYETNEQAFQLALLEKASKVFGEGTVWFVPQGTDLNMLVQSLTGSDITPIPVQ